MRISDWSSDVCSSDLGVIKQQTEGLDAILKSRWQDRQAYTANLSAADGRAKSLTAQADKLIALKVPQGDEVDQCRAARELLEKELMECGTFYIPAWLFTSRSEEHTYEILSLLRRPYAVFCL